MKLSLRTQKIISQNYNVRVNHNFRHTNSASQDLEKTTDNVCFFSEYHTDDLEKLWSNIESDFQEKKSRGLITKNKRFLKRKSTKSTKDKNNLKKYTQVETSIVREFIVQIGNEKKALSNKKSLEIYKKVIEEITKKYKLTLLNFAFHADETSPHLHFFATSYDFSTGEFSKKFNEKNSYEKMQKEIWKLVNKEVELEEYSKKECNEIDYITPKMHKKNQHILEKAKDYCRKKDTLELEKQAYKKWWNEELQKKTVEVENTKKIDNLQKELQKEKRNTISAREAVFSSQSTIDTLESRLRVSDVLNSDLNKRIESLLMQIREYEQIISSSQSNNSSLNQKSGAKNIQVTDAELFDKVENINRRKKDDVDYMNMSLEEINEMLEKEEEEKEEEEEFEFKMS